MIPRARFERLVRRAVDGLPPEFRDRLNNVDIIVEARPRRSHLLAAGIRSGHTLLGLYVGTPLTARTGDYHLRLPDRIIIFQEPVEAVSPDARTLVEQVRQTVLHELAHHFGIDDDRLAQLGVD